VLPRVDPADDGIHDPRRPIDDVERRMEPVLLRLPRRELRRILVGDPAGVDAVKHSAADVRVIMLSAAFAMFVCGWRVVFWLR
jgi:hypothetical protein